MWGLQPAIQLIQRTLGGELGGPWSLQAASAWALIVWAFLGLAATRLASLRLTYGASLDLRAGWRHGRGHFWQLMGGVVGVYLVVFLGVVVLAGLGWIARWGLGLIVVGLAWGVCLAIGFALLVVAGGFLLGGPLLWAASGVERTDALDCLSRTYAYVYQRPLLLAGYVLVAAGVGWVLEIGVTWVAYAVVDGTQLCVAIGAEGSLWRTGTTVERTVAAALAGWNGCVIGLAAAFPVAYLWSVAAAIYLLLRRSVDGVALEEASIDSLQAFP